MNCMKKALRQAPWEENFWGLAEVAFCCSMFSLKNASL